MAFFIAKTAMHFGTCVAFSGSCVVNCSTTPVVPWPLPTIHALLLTSQDRELTKRQKSFLFYSSRVLIFFLQRECGITGHHMYAFSVLAYRSEFKSRFLKELFVHFLDFVCNRAEESENKSSNKTLHMVKSIL